MAKTGKKQPTAKDRYGDNGDKYQLDSLPFTRARFIDNNQVGIDEIRRLYQATLKLSRGSRFEIDTHEDAAEEFAQRGLYAEARDACQAALALATPGYDAYRARALIKLIESVIERAS